jgi:leader peptidase (prepilin peptidase)/N-methyltransferase
LVLAHLAVSPMMVCQADLASFAAVVFAPAAGSLVEVLISRLPQGRPIVVARSCCDSCRRPLSAPELVPIVSYLALRGCCRTCCAPIAPYHLAVELAAIAIAIWATAVERDPVMLWSDCLLGWTLLALAWIDLLHMRLPDALTLPLLALGLLVEAATASEQIAAHVLGAIAGYLTFKGIAIGYRAVRGRDGLGGGDAKLLAVAGAWVGWSELPDVVLLAALLGIAGAIVSRARGHAMNSMTALPFGPCLAIALWIVRLHGPLIFGAGDYQ